MTVWVDATGSYVGTSAGEAFGSVWVADVGDYLPATTPRAPAAIPSGAVEIDFYMGYPNPASGTTAADFSDGSYTASPFSQPPNGWRWIDGIEQFHQTPDPPDTFVATGTLHLFVVVFQAVGTGVAPTADALTFAPASYVSGGTGPEPPVPVLGTSFPRAHLYTADGGSWVGDLSNAVGIAWLDQLSQAGTATFSLPLSDSAAASIVDRSVVKFSLLGAVRFGCQIKSEICELAVDGDGNRMLAFQAQPGLFGMLNEGTVLPEYGLSRSTGTDRGFGYMSVTGAWYVSADWVTPVAQAFSATGSGTHAPPSQPDEMKALNPSWISAAGPVTTVPAGRINWFRKTFTTTTQKNVQIYVAGDDYPELYLDGELLYESDRASVFAWQTAQLITVILPAGVHVLAAAVTNGVFGGSINPLAFALTMQEINSAGVPSTTAMLVTDTSWLVNDGQTHIPGWQRGQIARKLFDEMAAKNVPGVNALIPTFTDTTDSNGDPWSDPPTTMTFPIYNIGLGDAFTQLAATGYLDVWLDAAAMTINVYNRKGTDLSSTVTFATGSAGGSLMGFQTTRTSTLATRIGVQAASGIWQEVVNSAGETTVGGPIYSGLSLGSTSSIDTASQVAQQQLAESQTDHVEVTAESDAQVGPQLYVDCNLGDTVTWPAHRNVGTMPARILSVAVDGSGETVRVYPADLVKDDSV